MNRDRKWGEFSVSDYERLYRQYKREKAHPPVLSPLPPDGANRAKAHVHFKN